MTKHEITGDWVTSTQAEIKELADAVTEMSFPMVDELLREPAGREYALPDVGLISEVMR